MASSLRIIPLSLFARWQRHAILHNARFSGPVTACFTNNFICEKPRFADTAIIWFLNTAHLYHKDFSSAWGSEWLWLHSAKVVYSGPIIKLVERRPRLRQKAILCLNTCTEFIILLRMLAAKRWLAEHKIARWSNKDSSYNYQIRHCMAY